ncbi:MAG: metallophosphoesterase [bacterium]|nr:metallophosphoesterase [bacterium]
MSRTLSMIIFITIVTAVYFLLHYFVYKSMVHSLDLTPKTRKLILWLFWVSGSSFIVTMFISRMFKFHLLNFYAFIWLGIIAIAFSFFVLQRIAAIVFPSHARILAIVTLAVIAIVSLYSLFNGLRTPVVRNLSITLKELPKELSGFKIVFMADNHLESFKSKGRIVKTVDKVNELKPDLVLIAGDLVDPGALGEPLFCEQLKRIKATHGVITVAGNHEFYTGMRAFMEVAKCSDITVLNNQFTTVAGAIQIVGLEDDQGGQFHKGGGPDLEAATKGTDPTKPMIVLYHRPMLFEEGMKKGVDLQLSGHTHAGQIPPMDLIVWFYYKYPYGLYKEGDAYIYTTSGVGYWGPPMRFLVKPEIVEITLKSAE